MSKKTQILIVAIIILLAAASRLVKHPFNFTPIVAMAIFAGCYLNRRWGVVLPLGAMLISDVFIGFYDWQVMAAVYGSIILAYLVGWFLTNYKKWYFIGGASVVSSVIFFLITNFAVWAFFSWYPHTWTGLIECFTLALPFFRNTLFGDLFYSSLFFGLYEFILFWSSKKVAYVNNA